MYYGILVVFLIYVNKRVIALNIQNRFISINLSITIISLQIYGYCLLTNTYNAFTIKCGLVHESRGFQESRTDTSDHWRAKNQPVQNSTHRNFLERFHFTNSPDHLAFEPVLFFNNFQASNTFFFNNFLVKIKFIKQRNGFKIVI